jgi:hypothetical protein
MVGMEHYLPLPLEVIHLIRLRLRRAFFKRQLARMEAIYTRPKFWLTYMQDNATGYHFGFEGVDGSIQCRADGIARIIRFANR